MMSKLRFTFKGTGKDINPQLPNWPNLARLLIDKLDDPADYFVEDEGLIAAVNTALTLGMPLLLAGESGVGKTQLGYRIAYELGCGPIFFSVKSTTEAQDLFYHLDHLRRLHAAQANSTIILSHDTAEKLNFETTGFAQQQKETKLLDVRRFIRFQGLGLAILRAMSPEQLHALGLWEHVWPENERHSADHKYIQYGQRQPSVVIIDEIDKAPMDFCNDILEEIRRLQFVAPELDNTPLSIYQNPKSPTEDEKQYRPQIIITSNTTKSLPDAFLRRCIYYQMLPPTQEQLIKIINQRLINKESLPVKLDTETQEKSLSFYIHLRDVISEKKPSTAELLSWLLSLHEHNCGYQEGNIEDNTWLQLAQCCLIKTEQARRQFNDYYNAWRSN